MPRSYVDSKEKLQRDMQIAHLKEALQHIHAASDSIKRAIDYGTRTQDATLMDALADVLDARQELQKLL